jgi:hypothetical protein
MDFRKRNAGPGFAFDVNTAGKDRRRAFETRMVQEQPRQFGAGVACHSHHCGL